MSEDTKQKIRNVLREHMGAGADTLRDQEDLRGREDIEWVNLTMALETEFDLHLPDMVIEKSGTIDQIARFIDTVLTSRGTSPH